uniref:Ig-like domain-containing protein n=1 Tax=Chrysemys picta bellii TaxID=8478 RepID=A0A8C3F4U8_CHRPI
METLQTQLSQQSLPSFLSLNLLLGFSFTEEFSLDDFPHPVVGVIGQDVVLPCQLTPPARMPSMDVQWRKIGPGFILVHEYMDKGTRDLSGVNYQNRTELFLQEFSSGNVSVKLKRLQVMDDGKYRCFVRNPQWSLEATTELRVADTTLEISILQCPVMPGIGLACRSTGWFPKPELQWVGKNWQNLAMEIVTDVTQDRENLYSVVSHVTVTEGEDNGDIICIVQNGLLETERQSAIHLSGEFPPHPRVEWVVVSTGLVLLRPLPVSRFLKLHGCSWSCMLIQQTLMLFIRKSTGSRYHLRDPHFK